MNVRSYFESAVGATLVGACLVVTQSAAMLGRTEGFGTFLLYIATLVSGSLFWNGMLDMFRENEGE